MSMNKLLITQYFNWAGEITCQGFNIIDEDVWDKFLEKLTLYFEDEGDPLECWIGTNESIEVSSVEDFMNIAEVKPLENLEFDMLVKLLDLEECNMYDFGVTILSGFIEALEDNWEDEEDDDEN